MTNSELSNEFDVLWNNIMSNQAPGLDDYDKSVFLTKALDEILKFYFTPKTNKSLSGYDGDEIRLIDFSMVSKVSSNTTLNDALFDTHTNSKSVGLPTDIFMIVNELVKVTRDSKTVVLQVLPITYTEYLRLMIKPYKRPLKWLAWRLINNSTSNMGDLVVGDGDIITEYIVRYVQRPSAIILSDLDGVTIDGSSTAQSCKLDPILHREILLRAVELAKAAYLGDLSTQIALGLTSETNIGITTSSK